MKTPAKPNFTQAAKALGCSVPHLWLVLNGSRKSRSLEKRFRALPASIRHGSPRKAGAK